MWATLIRSQCNFTTARYTRDDDMGGNAILAWRLADLTRVVEKREKEEASWEERVGL